MRKTKYLILYIILMALCSCSTDPNLNLKILSSSQSNKGLRYSVLVLNPDNKKNYINASINSISQTVLSDNVKIYNINPNKDEVYKISIKNDNQPIGIYFILDQQPYEGWKFYFEKPQETNAEFIVGKDKVSQE